MQLKNQNMVEALYYSLGFVVNNYSNLIFLLSEELTSISDVGILHIWLDLEN